MLVALVFAIHVAPLFERFDDYVLPVVLLIGGVIVLWWVASQRSSTPHP